MKLAKENVAVPHPQQVFSFRVNKAPVNEVQISKDMVKTVADDSKCQ